MYLPMLDDGTIDWCRVCTHQHDGVACEVMDCTYQKDENGEPFYDKEPSEFARKPQTNADRIRAMSDEELANELLDLFAAFYSVEWSKEGLFDWLRQEASE